MTEHSNDADIIDKICKQIINVENNLCIYNTNGIMNSAPFKKNNVYKYKDIEYDLSTNVGMILFYESRIDNENYNDIIINLNNQLTNIDDIVNEKINLYDKYMPFSLRNFNSTNHTLLQNKISNTSGYNRFSIRTFTDQEYNIKNLLKKNRFVWVVKRIRKSSINYGIDKFLKIAEYESALPKDYLLQSINTIIVDRINLFNVSNGLRQINYPSIKQYNCYNKNIFDITIKISNIYDIDYEIASLYMSNITTEIVSYSVRYPTITMDTLNIYEIRRPNINLDWHIQLKEYYNYTEQEKLEKDIINNGKEPFNSSVCFVSRMPLYGNVFLLEVGRKEVEIVEYSDGNLNNITFHNTSCILVSSYVYHALYNFNNEKMTFSEYFYKLTDYEIINKILVKYNVSKFDALSSITNKQNSQILSKFINDKNFQKKKEILLSICKYGIYEHHKLYNDKNLSYITINLEKKSIYIGKCTIFDSDILDLVNTNNIVYNICIVK